MNDRTYGNRKPRAVRYPRQIVVMVSAGTGDVLDRLADESESSIGSVVRDLLDASLSVEAR